MKKFGAFRLFLLLACLVFTAFVSSACSHEKEGEFSVKNETSQATIEKDPIVSSVVSDSTTESKPTESKPIESSQPTPIQAPLSEKAEGFRLDQVGYLPESIKRAIVIGGGREFFVVEAETGTIVYTGEVEAGTDKVDDMSGDMVCYADFTSVQKPGVYYLYAPDGVFSKTFEIGDDVYDSLQTALLRMLFYQRCGCELDEKCAGVYAHPACHTYATAYAFRDSRVPDSDELSTPTDVYLDLTGGWHEAGDYSKQIASGVCAALLLLDSYRLYPDAFGDANNIPESGNGVPDILDEARWELEYLLKAQDPESGGVYYTVFQWRHPAMSVMPQDDTTTYYAYRTALESTGMVCQLMALASRIYQPFDSEFAAKCFSCAKECWRYLTERKDEGEVYGRIGANGYGVVMGNCATKPINTRYGAAVEMYLCTGEESYHSEIVSALSVLSENILNFYQHNLTGFATMSCIIGDAPYAVSKQVLSHMKKAVLSAAKKDYQQYLSVPYRIPMDNFYRDQTNQEILRRGMQMVLAQRIDPSLTNYDGAIENCLHYLLGQNALDFCMVSGFGTDSVRNYHHRQRINDGVDEPMPGYVVFGPYNLEHCSKTHTKIFDYISPGTPDMKAYVDENEFYRLNEIEVDTNTYPVFLIAHMQSKYRK